ncbi:hypothetical protein FA13DRAFT_1712770 [Coprinellus micaceus]|uniref:Uncharacterized protein n=1 Tax=Coprinellus micaceus TaxID=71717 RepID=A0A4Y7SZB2_COPMI|nr:hypothetical protein FA13DRAFT_1712770 [Coprinellus micaceus]
MSRFRALQDLATDSCAACIMRGSPFFNHAADKCSFIHYGDFQLLHRTIQYPTRQRYAGKRLSPCPRCHILPFNPADHPNPSLPCKCPHLLPAVLYLVFFHAKDRTDVHEDLGLHWASLEAFAQWVVEPNESYGTNAMLLLDWFRNLFATYFKMGTEMPPVCVPQSCGGQKPLRLFVILLNLLTETDSFSVPVVLSYLASNPCENTSRWDTLSRWAADRCSTPARQPTSSARNSPKVVLTPAIETAASSHLSNQDEYQATSTTKSASHSPIVPPNYLSAIYLPPTAPPKSQMSHSKKATPHQPSRLKRGPFVGSVDRDRQFVRSLSPPAPDHTAYSRHLGPSNWTRKQLSQYTHICVTHDIRPFQPFPSFLVEFWKRQPYETVPSGVLIQIEKAGPHPLRTPKAILSKCYLKYQTKSRSVPLPQDPRPDSARYIHYRRSRIGLAATNLSILFTLRPSGIDYEGGYQRVNTAETRNEAARSRVLALYSRTSELPGLATAATQAPFAVAFRILCARKFAPFVLARFILHFLQHATQEGGCKRFDVVAIGYIFQPRLSGAGVIGVLLLDHDFHAAFDYYSNKYGSTHDQKRFKTTRIINFPNGNDTTAFNHEDIDLLLTVCR